MKKVLIVITFSILTFLTFKILMPKSMIKLFEKILQEIKHKYGLAIAQNVEKIYRLETANLTSGQFKGTYSPGMMKFGESFPYGWVTLNNIFWKYKPEFAPIGFKSFTENPGLLKEGGGQKEFLQFPNLKSAMFTVAEFLKYYGNNPGRWYSKDLSRQTAYNNKLNLITTIYI